MKLFSEKVKHTSTNSSLNILQVENFEEIFFGVYEIEINKAKYLAEKVSEHNGNPVVSVPVVVEGEQVFYPFVLSKGKQEIIFNENSEPLDVDFIPVVELVEEKVQPVYDYIEPEPKPEPVVNKHQILEQIERAKKKARTEIAILKKRNQEELDEDARSKQEELACLLKEAKQEMVEEFVKISNKLKDEFVDSNDDRFSDICKTVDNKIQDLANSLEESLTDDFSKAVPIFESQVREMVRKIYEAIDPKVDEKLASIATDVVEKIALIEQSLDTKLESKAEITLVETVQKANIELHDTINKGVNKALSRVGNVSTKVDELTIALSEELKIVEEKITKYYDDRIKLLEEKTFDLTDELRVRILEQVKDSKYDLISDIRKIKDEQPIEYIIESKGKKEVKDFDSLRKEWEKQINSKIGDAETRLRKYIYGYGGGGGTVAQQFANGGTMNGDLTIVGNVSVTGTINGGGGGGGGGSDVSTLSGNWQNTYTTVLVNSGKWDSVYNTVLANSAYWGSSTTIIAANSANWNSTYTTVLFNSGNWNSTYTTVLVNSGNWNSVYNTVFANSGKWETAYTTLSTKANLSGGNTFIGNQTIVGNLSVTNSIITDSISANTLHALSAIFHVIDITIAELSGFNITGDVNIIGNLSTTEVVYANGGNSNQWNSTYSTVLANSSQWAMVGSDVSALSANWQNTFATVSTLSAGWESTHTTVVVNSANWNSAYNTITTISSGSQNVYTIVNANSASWNETYNTVFNLSTGWESTHTTVIVNSGNWNSTYNTVLANSAQWALVGSDVSGLSANWQNTYNTVLANSSQWAMVGSDVSGLSGNWQNTYTTVLTKSGNWENTYNTVLSNSSQWALAGSDVSELSANWEDTYTIMGANSSNWNETHNTVYSFSAAWSAGVSVSGAYVPYIGATQNIELGAFSISATNVTAIGTVFAPGGNSVRWNQAYNTVFANSGNWTSAYTTVIVNSANWQNAYTTVTVNSANWNSVYTTVQANSAIWNSITTGYVPYTGATQNVNLGAHNLTTQTEFIASNGANTLTLGGGVNPGGTNTQIAFGYSGTGQYPHFITTDHTNGGGGVGNGINFYTNDGVDIGVYPTNAIHGMTITRGRVGVGIVNPASNLDVSGNINATTTIVANGNIASTGGNVTAGGSIGAGTTTPGVKIESLGNLATPTINTQSLLRLRRPQTGGFKWGNCLDVAVGSYGTAINSQSRVDFNLAEGSSDTPDTNVMTLQSDKKVGIGTVTPNQSLTVVGNISATNVIYANGGNSNIWNDALTATSYAGAYNLPVIVDNGNGSINLSSGDYVFASDTQGTPPYKKFTIPGATYTLTNSAVNYVLANYNGGVPTITVSTSNGTVDNTTVYPIFVITRNNNSLGIISLDNESRGLPNKLALRFARTRRMEPEQGSLMISASAVGRIFAVTAGTVWYSASHNTLSAFNSSVNPLEMFYHNAGTWTSVLSTQFENSRYDNGTNLVALGANRYAVTFVYRAIAKNIDRCYMVLGQGNYTLGQAQVSAPPANLPIAIVNSIFVGRIICQEGSTIATQVDSPFDSSITYAGVTDHNALANLQGGAPGDYQHLTTAQILSVQNIPTILGNYVPYTGATQAVQLGTQSINTVGGNIGIGTTTPAARLEIASTAVDGLLKLDGGQPAGADSLAQIAFGFSGAPIYKQYIATHHNTNPDGNTIDFYTSDGTQFGTFPTNAIHGMTITQGRVGVNTKTPTEALTVTGNINATGHISATTKSFLIDNPNGGKLQYGVVESNEHGVYIRGKTSERVIVLPDHWDWLVDEDSVTVQLTPFGRPMNLYVISQNNDKVEIGGVEGIYNYTVYGTRKDVNPIIVEM